MADRERERVVRLTADLPSERRSRRRRQRVAELRRHCVVFLAVSLGMVVLWALSGFGYFWPMWPILGWGSGLFFHGRTVRAV